MSSGFSPSFAAMSPYFVERLRAPIIAARSATL